LDHRLRVQHHGLEQAVTQRAPELVKGSKAQLVLDQNDADSARHEFAVDDEHLFHPTADAIGSTGSLVLAWKAVLVDPLERRIAIRGTLALTGRLADGWVSTLMNWKPPAMAAQGNVAIDRAAREVGRDPREIRRLYNVTGALTNVPLVPPPTTTRQ
jgi:hypothetical protein